jgi:hypothetical protein
MHPKLFLSLWLANHALTLTLSPNRPKQDSHDPQHPVVPPGAYKMIFEPLKRSTQIAHLSYVKISTMSKLTESSIHFTLVT